MAQQRIAKSKRRPRPATACCEAMAAAGQSAQGALHPIHQLQCLLGNRLVARLIQAKRLTPGGQIAGIQRTLAVGAADDRYEQEADRVARQVMNSPDSAAANTLQWQVTNNGEDKDRSIQAKLLTERSRANNRIQRYTGHFPWAGTRWYNAPNEYHINGNIVGGGGFALISERTATLSIVPGTSGELTLNLWGDYIGKAGGSILTRSIARGTFRLTQKFPFRSTPEGVVTVDSSGIVPGSATNDPEHMNPFGIGESEIGMSFAGSSDGSSFVMETVTFTSGGSGVSVSVGPVGINTGGGTTNTHSVGVRINLRAIGARPAPSSPPATSATATATSSASVTVPMPASIVVPPPHSVYFTHEADTRGDDGALVRWASSLPMDVQAAIRTGRLTTSVVGYASTTGTDRTNFEHYSRKRAEWVREVLSRALGIEPQQLHVGWRGSYTAPPEDRAHPGGVANPHERRADILFEETTPTMPVSATARSSSSATAGR